MKKLIILFMSLTFHNSFCQKISIEQWNEKAANDKRMLPKYGYLPKSEGEKQADQDLIKTVMRQDGDARKGSNHLVELGFKYLYKDLPTAMSRFNQAWLVDSTNAEVYWGFGGIYMTLGDLVRAKKQYEEGLKIDPKNAHLLTDLATYYLSQYYDLKKPEPNEADKNLEMAINTLLASYSTNSKYESTLLKLSVCYWNKGDCENAWKYYDLCMSEGGRNITPDYTAALGNKCPK